MGAGLTTPCCSQPKHPAPSFVLGISSHRPQFQPAWCLRGALESRAQSWLSTQGDLSFPSAEYWEDTYHPGVGA